MSKIKEDDLMFTVKVDAGEAIEKLERIKELLAEINQLKDEIFGKSVD